MDKTVTTHTSNGAVAKQSLPVPRALFSEGGSVVFSELLAESTFRPERFALDLGAKIGAKKAALPQHAVPAQRQQNYRDRQNGYQQEIQRLLTEQRAQDRAQEVVYRETQERSLSAQTREAAQASFEGRDEQSRLETQTEARLAAQKRDSLYREEQHRREETRRDEVRSDEARSDEARSDEVRSDGKSTALHTEREQAALQGQEIGNEKSEEAHALQARNTSPNGEAGAQESFAKQEKEGKKGDSVSDRADGKAKVEAADNKAAAETRFFASEGEKSALESALGTLGATGEDTQSVFANAEDIDVFALHDSHRQAAQAAQAASALTQPSGGQEGSIAEGAGLRQLGTGEVSLNAEITKTHFAKTHFAETSVATNLVPEGEFGDTQKDAEERQILPTAAATATQGASGAASVATTTPPVSERVLSGFANISEGIRGNATPFAQSQEVRARNEGRNIASQKPSEGAAVKRASTTTLYPSTSEALKESGSPATAEEKNSALSPRTPHAALTRSIGAGTPPQVGGTTTQTATTQGNAPTNTLAQALSETGVRAPQATLVRDASALPENIEVRATQEVRTHRPDGLRLSGQNAFDSMRLAHSATQTTGYAGATGGGSAASSGAASNEGGTVSGTLNNADSAQATQRSSHSTQTAVQAAAKLAARTSERQEAVRERREATSPATSSATSSATKIRTPGTQALLQSLAARLTGGVPGGVRGEAAGNTPQSGNDARPVQTLADARFAQSFGSSGQGSQSGFPSGAQSESSFNNGFLQNLQGQASQASARASATPSSFTTASSFVREQVFVNVQRAIEGKLESLTVKLRPELLGRIEIRLDSDAVGRLQIVVLAERSETLDMLQRDARQLEQALQEAGVRTQDQGLQFGLKGQGNADKEGDAQQQDAGKTPSSEATDADEAKTAALDDENLAASVDRLQVRPDGGLNVKV